ncbi:MAG: hypothetical protein NC131_18580 [Roseburia sp.]|nr:hypothetical protein [Roseburia sp.]
MKKGMAVTLATILLLAIIILVKIFDKEIRESQWRERGIIAMFAACVGLYVYAFIQMIGGY